MSTNQYAAIDYRINSCLVGSNSYQVLSTWDAFAISTVEELTDAERQTIGHCFMSARLNRSKDILWMVPFSMDDDKLYRLLDAVEHGMSRYLGSTEFIFPLDVVSEDTVRAYVMRPIDRQASLPIRMFMPNVQAQRWEIAKSLFQRVAQMRQMGITSNGISREQMRVVPEKNTVTIWLNETLSMLKDEEDPEKVTRHMGFLSIPTATEQACQKAGIAISGEKRDIFSAAVVAFYMIMHSHPFVGSEFYRLIRNDYLRTYQSWPRYILEPGTVNNPGNQMLSRAITGQWERTTAKLKDMFNSIFLGVTHPKDMWDSDADCWDPQIWIKALEIDAEKNDNDGSRGEYHFENEMYHLV